jgi:hypothetical protein
VCLKLFELGSSILSSRVRLQNFVIKLYSHNDQTALTALCVPEDYAQYSPEPHTVIIRAAVKFADQLATIHGKKMSMLRISYKSQRTPVVQTVDCLTKSRLYYCGQDNFSYEDDGTPKWLEEDSTLMRPAEQYQI